MMFNNLKMIKKRGLEKELVLEVLFFIIAVVLTIFFWQNVILLTFLLFFLWIIAILLWHSERDIVVFVVSAIIGPIAEISIINLGGAWYYSKPSFFGIPLWLPFLWGFSGLLLYRIADVFYEWKNNR